MLEFNKIKLSDKDDIEKYLKTANKGICEHCFTDIFMWQGHYSTKFIILDDFLYIRSKDIETNQDYFMLPVGTGDIKQAIKNIEEVAKSEGIELVLVSITDDMVEKLEQELPDYFEFSESRDSADYIYLSEKLITLAGKKLHSKRNFVNRFMSENEGKWSFDELTDDNKNDAWNFHMKWHKETGCIEEDQSLEAETCAIKCILENYKELGVKGGILRVDGQVVAFSLGSKSTNDMFVVHIEKADVNYAGAYPTINKFFAETFCKEVTYINREEDLGLEGLRKAKLSYKPEILKMKYNAKIKG